MTKREIKLGPLEIRLYSTGQVDEIILSTPDGETIFHAEKMSSDSLWMRFYNTKALPLPEEVVIDWGVSPGGAIFGLPKIDKVPEKGANP